MKIVILKLLVFTILYCSLFGLVKSNGCALDCFGKYEKCLDAVHPGGKCRAEERSCLSQCNFSPFTTNCIEKCDKTFQNCPGYLGVKCFEAEKACYGDC
ncbi:hypothetical protein DICPUDRAFT_153150 [Dictyostelium purpureum]|uniref:Uncharacterized protein n=1 Tax=Dictyostelium purpureum TaxID=5786 RepID=F0ZN63_DICPU|nr:uncharacterized protein DICPUDRAFT_153150 [Dictyostelium purpureum]EGC34636.1 hypothetical protein DICPUDRAFT_153150 [Dictyostelium purpureum]|eukprot:XP_003288861.1 hypothetical protein DICPUDRAFT_153150 [Dictyostelium purpureum]